MRIGTRFFVGLMFALTIAFVCAVLWINHEGGNVSDALIYGSFAWLTCEAFAMAGIKISGNRNRFTDEMDGRFGQGGTSTSNCPQDEEGCDYADDDEEDDE